MSIRNWNMRIIAALVIGLVSAGAAVAAEADSQPTADEQMAGLVKMCADSEAARVARQEAKPLYFRLGEYDRIHDLTKEIVRLHSVNDDFTRFWDHVDEEGLARSVANFVSSGTGGPDLYTGQDMPAAHAHLELSTADFLSAGADVTHAMQNEGYGEDEIQELICILVSMKDLVITR